MTETTAPIDKPAAGRKLSAICVYCGSNRGNDPSYVDAAVALGKEFVTRDIRLVYGGGAVGLMGVLANTVLSGGGTVTGVIPEFLYRREIRHESVGDMRVVSSMHERKAIMASEADAFIALPGGLGTFEELFEVLTWTQLGLHDKPVAVFEVNGFWDGLLAFMDRAVDDGFLKADVAGALVRGSTPSELLERFASWTPPARGKWLELDPGHELRTDLF